VADRDPTSTLGALWARGLTLAEARDEFLRELGEPVGIQFGLEFIATIVGDFAEILNRNGDLSGRKFVDFYSRRELRKSKFEKRLIRDLNSGRRIAIGYKLRSETRRDLDLVWDGKIVSENLDWINCSYCGANWQFEELRILTSDQCHPDILAKYQRLRAGLKGRPAIAGINAAIERAISKHPELAAPSFKKRLAGIAHEEMQLMQTEGKISRVASERTILNAINSNDLDE
jgi:hypothetical protein